MGYLTTITISNDALHSFEKDPKAFAEAVFKGIHQASRERKQVSVGFKSYCNYINVDPSRHADDETIYLHSGNGVTNLNSWNDDFKGLVQRMPKVAGEYVAKAQRIITQSKKYLKENK